MPGYRSILCLAYTENADSIDAVVVPHFWIISPYFETAIASGMGLEPAYDLKALRPSLLLVNVYRLAMMRN